MLDRFFHFPVHQYIYWICALGIAVGLPTSVVILSISSILASLNFLIEGGFYTKWSLLRSNKMALLILTLFLLHLLGLLWSENQAYGWHDIKIKLPLLCIPVVFLGIPKFPNRVIKTLLLSFVVATVATSIINWGVYAYKGFPRIDMREIALFGSHIRFALLVAFSFAVCLFFAIKISSRRWLFIVLSMWLMYYTIFSEVLIGYLCLFAILVSIGLWWLYRRKRRFYFFSGLFFMIAFVCSTVFFFLNTTSIKPPIPKNLPLKTVKGNDYIHHPEYSITENGHYLFLFIAKEELKTAWNNTSEVAFDSTDTKGQKIYATLIRYMTSKGLHKDAEGFAQLSKQDIRYVENGISSILYINDGAFVRLKKLKWELQGMLNPNGHSLLQRFEYWKTAWKIIRENVFFGVGTGDVNDVFQQKYKEEKSVLSAQNRLRAHQQLLTFWVSFGVFGFVLFILIHVYFAKYQWQTNNLLGLLFLLIVFISYLSEDTLETQVGVTFFSFFIALFSSKHKKTERNC